MRSYVILASLPQVVEKSLVIKEKKSKYVVMEKDCLNLCKHPNIVRLYCTFQVKEIDFVFLV